MQKMKVMRITILKRACSFIKIYIISDVLHKQDSIFYLLRIPTKLYLT